MTQSVSKALRHAQWLENDWDGIGIPELLDVAVELRRLHAAHAYMDGLTKEYHDKLQGWIKLAQQVEAENKELKARMADLETSGPQVVRGERTDGTHLLGTMRQAWDDAQQDAAAEAHEVERLRERLIVESQRTAEEKRRAAQPAEQHRMQAQMHSEARAELARILTLWSPITEEMVAALRSARDIAMNNTMSARIPECGDFGVIAQNLEAVLNKLEQK